MVRISTITALLLLALSAIISARAYARISEIESPTSGILGAIPIGKRDYQLQSVSPLDEKLRCLGSTSLEVRNDSGTVVIVRSNVRIKVREERKSLLVFVGAFFNALDQLVRANITLEVGERKVEIALSNPNPINLEISTLVNETKSIKHFVLPGPVFLRENSDQSYRLDFQAVSPLFAGSFAKPSWRGLGFEDLRLVEVPTGEQCMGEDGELPLDSIALTIQQQLEFIKPFLGILGSESSPTSLGAKQ